MLVAAVGAHAAVPAEHPASTFDTSAYAAATGYMADPHLTMTPGGRVFAFVQRGNAGTPNKLVLRWTDTPRASEPAWSAAVQVSKMTSAHAAAAVSVDGSTMAAVFSRTSTSRGHGRDLLFRRITALDGGAPAIGAEQAVARSTSSTAYGFGLVAVDGTGRLWSSVRYDDGSTLRHQIRSAPSGSDAPAWSLALTPGAATTNVKAWPLALQAVGGRVVFVYADPAATTPGVYSVEHTDGAPIGEWSAPSLVSRTLPTSPAWDGASAVPVDRSALFVGYNGTTSRFDVHRYDPSEGTWSPFGSVDAQDGALATSAQSLVLVARSLGSLYVRDAPVGGGSWSDPILVGNAGQDVSTARLPMLGSTSSTWVPAMWSLGNAPAVAVRYQALSIAQPAPDGTPPSAPVLSDAGAKTQTTADLTWCCASDDTGIASYGLDVARDAAFADPVTGYVDLNVGPVSSYQVTGLVPETTYFARVRARDAAGNTSGDSNVISFVTQGAGTRTLVPVADTYAAAANASANFGTSQTLEARFDPQSVIYLGFDPGSATGAALASAELRLTVEQPSLITGGVLSTVADSSWSESGVTWNARPAIDARWLHIAGPASTGAVVSFDVLSAFDGGTGAVVPSGPFTLAIISGASDDVSYRSREASSGGPQLLLSTSAGSPSPAPAHITRAPYVQSVVGTSAIVAWRTALPGPSTVRYGTTEALGATATGATGDRHAVRLTGLEPGARIYYAIEADGALITPVGSFRAAPAPGSTFTFTAFGDSGVGSADQLAVAARQEALDPDLVLHLGDVVYPASAYLSWDPYVFFPYRTTLGRAPLFGSFGNHEAYTGGGAPYLENLYLPENGGSERFYSFDYGDAHFVSVDSEQSVDVGSAQYEWLAADLHASVKPWKVVFFHKPIYSSSPTTPPDPAMVASLAPLFSRENVALVLNGHSHTYERSTPQGGVVYVVSGGGGAQTYPLSPSSTTAFAASVHHITRVTVGPTRLALEAVLPDGSILDSWTATRDETAPVIGTLQSPTDVGATSMRLSWSAATDEVGVAGYRVDVATDEAFTSPVTAWQNRTVGDVLTVAVTGLAPVTTYYARIRAVDAAGNVSADSNIVAATTLESSGDVSPPVAGTLSVDGATSTTSVGLSWTEATDDTGVTGYRLDVATDAAFTSMVAGYDDRDVGMTTSAVATGLNRATTYWARIRAVDAAGNVSSSSNAVAGATAIVVDEFDRTVGVGWGSTGALAWTTSGGTAADYSVNGDVGVIQRPSTASRYATVAAGELDGIIDVRFRFTGLPSSGWSGVYVLARSSGIGSWYALRARTVVGGADDIEFNKNSAATGLVKVGTGAVIPELVPGSWYRAKVSVSGDGVTSTLRAKLWQDGAGEPAGWMLTATDTTPTLQSSTGMGIRVAGSILPSAVEVDRFEARLP